MDRKEPAGLDERERLIWNMGYNAASDEVERLRRVLNEIALRTSPYREQWDTWPLVSGIDQLVRDAGGDAYVGGQSKNES